MSIFSCSLENDDSGIDKELWKSDYLYNPSIVPEIINNESIISYSYDIWWVGCTVIDMLTGKYLQYRMDTKNLMKIIESFSELEKLFINSMVIKNQTDRWTAEELLKHEFIRNISIDNSDNEQSIIDDSPINRKESVNIIQNAINNRNIGLLMGLKCEKECQHKFCLSSVTATNFAKGKLIGNGWAGKVTKVGIKPDRLLAIKIIKNIHENNYEAKYLENNINKYRESIQHDNIVKYFGAVRNLNKIFIFMEFIDGESLNKKINYNSLPLISVKIYTNQILQGLAFLHKRKIIHRDIKSANILINKCDIAKISDFGLSRFLRSTSRYQKKTFCGTANYMSPEVINDEPYDCSADIWSLGATVFEMVTGYPPYHNLTEAAVVFKIGLKKEIEYPSDMSDDIRRFLNLMLHKYPGSRSSAKSLLNEEFFIN